MRRALPTARLPSFSRYFSTSFQAMARITDATPKDIDELITFGRAEFSRTFGHLYTPKDLEDYLLEGYHKETYEQWISDPKYHIYVSRNEEGAMVGYSLVSPCGLPLENCGHDASHAERCGELKRIYIHPSAFGTGVAVDLTNRSLDWLTSQGYEDRVYLGVYSDNLRAQRFYSRHGFEKVGEYGFPVGESVDREFIMKWSGKRV